MTRMVKRLSQLEIDEISLVDRPANQHGLVAIAKNDQEDTMPELYDAEGTPVAIEDLNVGDFVYDEQGNEFNYVITDDEGDQGEGDLYEYEDEGADSREYAQVGKAGLPRGPLKAGQSRLGFTASHYGQQAREAAKPYAEKGKAFARKNKGALIATGAGVGGAGAGYGAGSFGKSYGQEVLETLSKAVSTSERDVVVAKAFDAVEEIAKRNDTLEEAVSFLLSERERGDYVELAKNYELPVEYDELGGLLHRASQVLDSEDLERLDRILSGASEVNKALYDEMGYSGQVESDALSAIYAAADQAVAKNAELGLTREQAVTALFTANPEAYDQYELEQNQR